MKRLIDKNAIFNTSITIKEDNKKLEFDCNKEYFYKIKIDTGLLNNNTQRCDYAILSKDEKFICLFIEFKGNDIEHALEQIKSSSNMYGKCIEDKYVVIIANKVPRISCNDIKLKKRILNNGFKDYFIKSKILKLKYSNNEIIKIN